MNEQNDNIASPLEMKPNTYLELFEISGNEEGTNEQNNTEKEGIGSVVTASSCVAIQNLKLLSLV